MRLMNRPRIGDLTTRRPSNMMERALRILESKKKRSTPVHRTPSPSNSEKRSCRRISQENNSHPSTPVLALPSVQLAAGETEFACTSLHEFRSSQQRTSEAQLLKPNGQATTLRPKLKAIVPNSQSTSGVNSRPSSALLPERVSCLSSAALEALAFNNGQARQSRKRRAQPNG